MSTTAVEKIEALAEKLRTAHYTHCRPEKEMRAWNVIEDYRRERWRVLAREALLQQGEPEGWRRIANEALRKYAKSLRVSEAKHPGSTYGMLKPEAVEEAADHLKNSFLSASPLPPAPGAETDTHSSRQAVLEDVLNIVEKHFVAEAAKGVSNTYGEYGATVIASLRNEIRALATTPPAEGETK